MNSLTKLLKNHTLKIAFVSALALSSCDQGFEEMNTNPNAFTDPVISSLFSNSLIKTAGDGDNNTLYANSKLSGCFVQYFSSLNPWQWTGDKYLYKQDYNKGLFETAYSSELKETAQIIDLVKDKPELSNYLAVARIWRVYILHRVTDMYGDIPYTQAGQGYTDAIYKPAYDTQSEIYPAMLKDLEDNALALDAAKTTFGNADFIYKGDVTKWKRFAHSLMLRLGMRLTKVDPALAQTWVKKAIAGGVMQSNADIAKLDHTGGSANNWNVDAYLLQGGEGVPPSAQGKGYSKLSKTFIDYLKATKDPRMPFYATLWQGNADASKLPQTTAPDVQKGLPSGYDYTTIKSLIPNWTDNMQAEYSEINIHTIASLSTPTIFQSYAEVSLLLAEAALRGWSTDDVKTRYENAVRASMESETLYPGGLSISPAAITAYLTANPFAGGSFEKQMEQIHNQFWVSMFMTNVEAYANWRRTGYPKLTPTNYAGNETGGTIPRRLRYPESEASLNTDAYTAAVQKQGPDLFTTRVWWDK
ncbi:SusD/RagB family nutrient-binding outer membrane lipoprotein [Larkinella insperata]|uniref:SusD/RagB family nutrient-binding outer membrane lipoprotein n=1 Tax=Larkinella insperata TaxID=332158 RepID=A0ABW3Q5P4_9BACT|nr:SusD/RagB family nutrient-binding outer membrane lipoprotein [Larkinella insperata]